MASTHSSLNPEWSSFPGRLRVRSHDEHLFSAYDALRHVGITPHKRLLTSFKKFTLDSATMSRAIHSVVPDCLLNQGTFGPADNNARKFTTTPCMSWHNLQAFVCFVLRRSQKSSAEIQTSLQDFSIPRSRFDSAFVGSAEKDTLTSLKRALPYRMYEQFRVGEYRVDAYFPELRIVVGCDEHDHKGYNAAAENERRLFVEKTLQCVYLTYDPFDSAYDVLDVVHMIISTLASPMYQRFMAHTAVHIVPPLSKKLHGAISENTQSNDTQTSTSTQKHQIHGESDGQDSAPAQKSQST